MAIKKGALVVSDGDDQGATEANHEVRHSEAEDEDVEGLEEGRIPQHHGDHKTVVKNWYHSVDEHEERKYTVAHPGEDGGCHSHHLGVDRCRMRAPRCAVAVHGAQMRSSFGEAQNESVDSSAQEAAASLILSFLIQVKPPSCSYFPDCAPVL